MVRGLALTGALGVGKSYIQRLLVTEHGYWSPHTTTTRPVADEQGLSHVAADEFSRAVKDQQLVLPISFAGYWYAWSREDFSRLMADRGSGAVLNVRPYTALLLSSFLDDLTGIWLWLPQDELDTRRAGRAAERDRDLHGVHRLTEDSVDMQFEALFALRVVAGPEAIKDLLRIAEQ